MLCDIITFANGAAVVYVDR